MVNTVNQPDGELTSYPFAGSAPAVALSDALKARSDQGVSLRTIAGRLGYKSAVVLSHMRTGRLAVPIERATDIAEAVGLEPVKFLTLVLEHRYPDALAKVMRSDKSDGGKGLPAQPSNAFLDELDRLAGRPLQDLPNEHLGVIREVVADRHPRRRWLTIAEASMMNVLREVRPDLMRDGLTVVQLEGLRSWAGKLG